MAFSKTFCVVIMIVGLVLAEPGVQDKKHFHPRPPVKRQKRLIATAVGLALGATGLATGIAGGSARCNGGSCAWGDEYSCHPETKFNYGCKDGYCWSQCDATAVAHKEWCYIARKSNNTWWRCSRDEDCKEATKCSKAKCSGGCSV